MSTYNSDFSGDFGPINGNIPKYSNQNLSKTRLFKIIIHSGAPTLVFSVISTVISVYRVTSIRGVYFSIYILQIVCMAPPIPPSTFED